MSVNPELLKILACPICKTDVEPLNSKIRCLSCSEKFIVEDGIPMMLPEKLSQDLKLTVDKWNNRYRKMSFQDIERAKSDYELVYLKDIVKYLDKFWVTRKKGRYLEIGCGPAFLGLEMAKRGLKVFGLDVSIEGIRIAKQVYDGEGKEGLFVCGNLLDTPYKADQFDFIYGGGVIEHFRDTEKAIRELYRMLRKDGSVFTTVPCLSLSSLTYRQLWGNIPDLIFLRQLAETVHIKMLKKKHMRFGYEKSFTIRKLASVFKEVGFKDLDIGLFRCYLPLYFVKNEWFKKLFRKLSNNRLFWPMVYVKAVK